MQDCQVLLSKHWNSSSRLFNLSSVNTLLHYHHAVGSSKNAQCVRASSQYDRTHVYYLTILSDSIQQRCLCRIRGVRMTASAVAPAQVRDIPHQSGIRVKFRKRIPRPCRSVHKISSISRVCRCSNTLLCAYTRAVARATFVYLAGHSREHATA